VKIGPYLFPDEPIPGNYFFDVKALSRTENPDAQMRRALNVAQAFQNYGAIAAQGALALENPNVGPIFKTTWTKILEGAGLLMARFLAAANVDDGEKFVVELKQLGIDAENAFAQFASQAARAAQAGGAAPGEAGLGGGGPLAGAGGLGGSGNGFAG
jgi:hypothetical protein